MRVAVLGGTGFIGPHVVRILSGQGHSVTVVHRGQSEPELPPAVAHLHGNWRSGLPELAGALRQLRPDVVLHMVPLREQDITEVQAAVRGSAQRLVMISSMDVYRAYGRLTGVEPGPPDPVPLTEDAPLRETLFPYRAQASGPDDFRHWYDKIPAERAALGDPELPGTVLRLPMVYGPGDYQHRLFPYLKRMDDGRPAILLGERMAQWRTARGYVDDVAAAIALAVVSERAAGRVYNVAEREAHTEAAWVRRIAQAAGWPGELVTVPEAALPEALREQGDLRQHLVASTERIRSELGYAEGLPPEEALARTVAWERAHPPQQLPPGLFDYAAEDAVLTAQRRA